VNDYQPLGIRIITPKDGYTIPELLDEAKRGNIPEELKINRQRIFDLLDNKIPSTNPQNEAFKELLIATCNHLHTTFTFLFEKINDYTELLLPDDLTSDFSIVKDVRDGMLSEDCKNVEIIGWLYQFYISEKKDEVFASKTKIKKEDIPAATQLFTPRWIVEYMVQNTLGKLWLQNRPKSRLREHMPFFIESESLMSNEYLEINSPEEIKFADPASGSGHIMVYAFDLFTKIYEEEGYNTSEIPQLIIGKNLYGFEIDERAAQLSGLALMLKAREYHRRVFHKELNTNILCFKDLLVAKYEIEELFNSQHIQVTEELIHDLFLMQQATNFGSLIIPNANSQEINGILEKLISFQGGSDIFKRNKLDNLIVSVEQIKILHKRFHCVVTNPPYMGGGNLNNELSKLVKEEYPKSKADLMSCFIERGIIMIHKGGFLGMINQHTWMFKSSYEDLRKELINNIHFDTLLHLGTRTFPEIGGEVVQNASFTIWNVKSSGNGIYIRLVDYNTSELKRTKALLAIQNSSCAWHFKSSQYDYLKIPGTSFGYWLSEDLLQIFDKNNSIAEYATLRQGMSTTDADKYVRYWHEISNDRFNKDRREPIANDDGNRIWYPFNKGGEKRKWYGNLEHVVRYEKNGEYLLNLVREKYPRISDPEFVIKNRKHYFLPFLTYSSIGSGISARYVDVGSIFSVAGPAIFPKSQLSNKSILGYLNTRLVNELLLAISPTIGLQATDIEKLPFIEINDELIDSLVSTNIEISKAEWDSRETSWDFKRNEILKIINTDRSDIEDSYNMYIQFWKLKFETIYKNETELHKRFLTHYDLHNEYKPEISISEVTLLKSETKIHKGAVTFNSNEVFTQLLSYFVGCIFGRYSLDKDGLILANKGEVLQDYLNVVSKPRYECYFLPDADNIISVLDEEWFEDDIVGKFYKFLKVTFGEKNFNKNLAFIEEQIGKDIRKYFIKDFYPDHIKRYKKRPIYWMFSSPKGSFNVLIYMHRYTPDTVSNILNKYLKEFIGKLNTRKEHLERVKESGSVSDKSKAIKESDNIQKMLVELHEYERDILYPLATERIEIDLDDGVLVNYNKFGKAVKEVNGLNDPATKKKVKQFDWIDTTQIR
ncbi:MAG: BREX-1 system adenine-specific DNA-methyltransferase PglX, partial [Bacteroidales bacterium]|nr:BREX-1 system adenine-specific DNA-methyltransferase PglX [Bacteroidales bacterium]